ncbi:uncharacterized protein LOC112024607 isoform X2 [Quercus suber]|uniref:uncharacterized protein LOC112024607 isoform X2 n=1 Tax=Quercus suber TaxID=58331 RepID=UPI0032DF6D4E
MSILTKFILGLIQCYEPNLVMAAWAISFARGLGCSSFILESDFDMVIKTLISEEESLSAFGHILALAKANTDASCSITFSHVQRFDRLFMTDVDDKSNLKEKSLSEWSRIQSRKEMIRSLTQMLTKESEEDTASQNIIYDSRKLSSLYKRPPQTEKGCTARTWEYDQAF